MYYVCIENNAVINICNYLPNIGEETRLVEISDDDYKLIKSKKKIFDVVSNKLIDPPMDILKSIEASKLNSIKKKVLCETDWLVLRHIRETALGIETSLTHDQYIDLEKNRQRIASGINS